MSRIYRRKRQSGAAVVEFAITLIFLLLLSIGLTEIGRAFWYYSALQKATRDGARYVSMQSWSNGSPVTACRNLVRDNAVSAGVPQQDAAGTLLTDRVNVLCDGSACNWGASNAPEYITVEVRNYRMHWLWSITDSSPVLGEGNNAGAALRIQSTMPYMR